MSELFRSRAPRSVTSRAAATLLACTLLLSVGACASNPTSFEALADAHLARIDGEVRIPGLRAEVEVLRDPWGVPHIFARNLDDLFFAQGFVQAQDRLWQMEMYRRAGEGRLSEVLGPEALRHDRLARLVRFRGPWDDAEFTSYHPEGRRILEAFAAGVNGYIDHARAEGELPVEFALTGIEPEYWTAETPLLRMLTAMPLGDARGELRLAQRVAELGPEEANRRARPTPWRELVVPEGVDLSLIDDEVASGLGGFRGPRVRPDLVAPFDGWLEALASLNLGARETSPGSNNWAIHGDLTATGEAIVANDPHRGVSNPSLRYMVHLDAPGWTAIGSTEPVLPGVAIGHNGRIAWGLTIVGTDQSDVYVEEVHPDDPDQVRWRDGWEPLRVIHDTIAVKGGEPEVVELKYSRHGPIFHEDRENGLAYALRSTMHEPGTTGYLASLRLNVASDCVEFLEEMRYWTAPTENMVCGDADGNIAWQAAALSPSRDGWHGRLPVPGNGTYEWEGFRDDLPTELNPERGWIATANHDIHPPGYDPPLYFKRASSFSRFARLEEVLSAGSDFTVEDSRRLQNDAYSRSSHEEAALYRGWTASDQELEPFRADLAAWDGHYRRDSRAAAIARRLSSSTLEEAADAPEPERRAALEEALAAAVADLRDDQGDDPARWRWGRDHRSEFPHSLVSAYDLPAAERSGGAGTVAATGATFRQIVDFADIDGSLASNAPGQSARPGSPYYGNLTESWAAQEYFPMLFSREAVEARAEHRLVLRPASPGTGSAPDNGQLAPDDRSGRMVIVGGSLDRDNDAVYRAVLDARSGEGPFCVLPTASGVPERSMASAVEAFRAHGGQQVEGIYVTTENPEAASDPAVVARLRACSGFWFTGGVQSRVVDVFRPEGVATPGYDALMERFEAGAVVAGSSAGAAMLPPRMIAGGGGAEALQNGVVSGGGEDGVIVRDGMGFLDHAVIDQHFLARGRIGRLLVATLAGVGDGVGIGIDENTAVVVDGVRAAVLGESGAVLVDARGADRAGAGNGGRGIRLHLIGSGDTFDLESLVVTPASDKVALETAAGSVEAPEEPFARWAFLKLLSALAASDDRSVEMTAPGYRLTVEKGEGFEARSYGRNGVQDTPAGLSAGPFLVSLVPDGTPTVGPSPPG